MPNFILPTYSIEMPFGKITKAEGRTYGMKFRKSRRAPRVVKAVVKNEMYRAGEKKYRDTDMNGDLLVWNVSSLVQMVQGTTPSTRVGRKIAVHSVHMIGSIKTNEDAENDYFIGIGIQRDCAGVNPVRADVYDQVPYLGSLRAMARIQDFKMLKTMRWHGYGGTAVGDQNNMKIIDYYHKFKTPLIVTYNLGNTGGVGDVDRNNLFFVQDSRLTGQDVDHMEMKLRIVYTDI